VIVDVMKEKVDHRAGKESGRCRTAQGYKGQCYDECVQTGTDESAKEEYRYD
jgi:hypothetical protein